MDATAAAAAPAAGNEGADEHGFGAMIDRARSGGQEDAAEAASSALSRASHERGAAGSALSVSFPYECARCKDGLHRKAFLITATDVFGRLQPDYDWQGKLEGLCFTCARFRDLYTDCESEEAARKQFTADALERHAQRSIVVNQDYKALKKIENIKRIMHRRTRDLHRARQYSELITDLAKDCGA